MEKQNKKRFRNVSIQRKPPPIGAIQVHIQWQTLLGFQDLEKMELEVQLVVHQNHNRNAKSKWIKINEINKKITTTNTLQ